MRAGVKVRNKETKYRHDPGHMAIYWAEGQERIFRGFRFEPTDLPEEFRPRDKWREYFIDLGLTTAGYITDDINVRDDVEENPEVYLCACWDIIPKQVQILDKLANPPRQFKRYSFKPDPKNGCYNCVSWAIETINDALGLVLHPVKDGRIKYIIEQIKQWKGPSGYE